MCLCLHCQCGSVPVRLQDPNHPHCITLTLCPDWSWAQNNYFPLRGNSEGLRRKFAMGSAPYRQTYGSQCQPWHLLNQHKLVSLWERAWFWWKIKDPCTQHNVVLYSWILHCQGLRITGWWPLCLLQAQKPWWGMKASYNNVNLISHLPSPAVAQSTKTEGLHDLWDAVYAGHI